MRAVSPGCRSEIESALSAQSDVSDDCKQEIQTVLQSFAANMQKTQQHGEIPKEPPRDGTAEKQQQNMKTSAIHPGIWVLLFVIVFFSAVGIYVMYVNKILTSAFPEKRKKLSKKKVLGIVQFKTFASIILFLTILGGETEAAK